LVVADRVFDTPVDVESLWARDDLVGAPTLRRLCTYSAPDRLRTACVYEAPQGVSIDALAGRSSAEAIWEAVSWFTQMGRESITVEADRCIVVLQRWFPDGTSAQRLTDGVAKGQVCFETHRVQPVESYIRLDGKVSMCMFTAPDAESVRIAVRTLGISIVRAWTATPFVPPPA
jgi:hypothetical protein